MKSPGSEQKNNKLGVTRLYPSEKNEVRTRPGPQRGVARLGPKIKKKV